MNSEKLPQLDSIIHSRIRLAVISLLTSVRQADFNYLKNTIGTTDGNLSTHLTKLEEAGYISVKKSFKEKKTSLPLFHNRERERLLFSVLESSGGDHSPRKSIIR